MSYWYPSGVDDLHLVAFIASAVLVGKDSLPQECLGEEIVNKQLVSVGSLNSKVCENYLDMDFSTEDCWILVECLIFCLTFSKTSHVLLPLFLFLSQNFVGCLLDELLELYFLSR